MRRIDDSSVVSVESSVRRALLFGAGDILRRAARRASHRRP